MKPGSESAQPVVDYCLDKCGIALGKGARRVGGQGFRIARIGHCNAPMLFGSARSTLVT